MSDLFNTVDPYGTGMSTLELCRVDSQVTVKSGFQSLHCFGLIGNAALSRYLVIVYTFRKVKQHQWRYDGCDLKSTHMWELIVEASKRLLLACTEALCTSRVGEGTQS